MGTVIFFGWDGIGSGDADLGAVLTRVAAKTLGSFDPLPDACLFMNAGVKLCCAGSTALDALVDLEARGVDLLCCGTCLDWFHLKDALKVGRVSNMHEILSLQNTATRVIRL